MIERQKLKSESRRRRARMASVSSIVARSFPGKIIGIDNKLPWSLPTDLRHFKNTTSGKAVIMGRRTFESIGRPLPNRFNIVLSRDAGVDGKNLVWAETIESALFFADVYSICSNSKEIFVVGGSQMYSAFEKFVNKIYLTDVMTGLINGDASFEFEFEPQKWKTISEIDYPRTDIDQYAFRISIYRKKKSEIREEFIDKFLDPSGDRARWLERAVSTGAAQSMDELAKAAQQLALEFDDEHSEK